MKKIISLGAVLSFAPLLAFAAPTGTSIFTILGIVGTFLNTILPLLVTLGVVYFVWGIVQYVISSDEEVKGEARQRIVQGLMGLFVIVCMWGLIALVRNTFGISQLPDQAVTPCVPTSPTNGNYVPGNLYTGC